MMDLATYQQASRQTALYPDRDRNLWYPALGLIGEFQEWKLAKSPADQRQEAGDVAWYCAQVCAELQVSIDSAIAAANPRLTEPDILMTLAEGVKKWHRDGGDDSKRQKILTAVGCIWQQVVQQSEPAATAALLQQNIDKLRDRQARGVIQGSGDNR
jgi:NTP pyrophosphatase (non-canonical NTP hydrolase)